MHTENQSWVVERGGEAVDKKAGSGTSSLTDWERLVYCLWITDYMMRNAGDFANAEVMYPDFQTDAARFAKNLGLAATYGMFSRSRRKLQREYFDRFETVCAELRGAEHRERPNTPLEATRVSPFARMVRWFRQD